MKTVISLGLGSRTAGFIALSLLSGFCLILPGMAVASPLGCHTPIDEACPVIDWRNSRVCIDNPTCLGTKFGSPTYFEPKVTKGGIECPEGSKPTKVKTLKQACKAAADYSEAFAWPFEDLTDSCPEGCVVGDTCHERTKIPGGNCCSGTTTVRCFVPGEEFIGLEF